MGTDRYKKGEVDIITPKCETSDEFGWCHHTGEKGHHHRSNEGIPVGHAFLPHQCDEWVIGDIKGVETLISDLQELLKEMRKYI